MADFQNKMKTPIEQDSKGVKKVIDSTVTGQKAIPVVFVTKQETGFDYSSTPNKSLSLDNKMKTSIEQDNEGIHQVVDEDTDGLKAIPLVAVTKNADGKFEYATLHGGGANDLPAGSITTDKIADKAVTDEKLATPKVSKSGDQMEGPLDIIVSTDGRKLTLAKTQAQSGNNNAPTTIDLNSTYLLVGGTEYNTNSYRLIGFGYHRHGDKSHSPAVIGYQEINAGKDDMGDLLFATRNSTSDIEPSIHLRVKHDGQVELEQAGYTPASDKAIPNKKYVDGKVANLQSSLDTKLTATKAATQADSTATDINGLVSDFNALLAKLKAAGIMASS